LDDISGKVGILDTPMHQSRHSTWPLRLVCRTQRQRHPVLPPASQLNRRQPNQRPGFNEIPESTVHFKTTAHQLVISKWRRIIISKCCAYKQTTCHNRLPPNLNKAIDGIKLKHS